MRELFQNITFRRLFVGRLVTNAGDSLYYIAAMMLVYELGGSAFYTGLAGFLTLGPQALQFLTGPLVDRWPLRRVLVGTQLFQGLVILTIPVAYWTGHLTIGLVLVVMPTVAMASQFVYPAQSATLPRIVDDERLVTANSAFTISYQGVDAAFSAVGGILVTVWSAITVFVFDVVSFLLTALVFATLEIPPARDTESPTNDDRVPYRTRLREGLHYVRGTILSAFIAVAVFVNAFVAAAMAVLPVFADGLGGSGAYGLLLAGITGGLLGGAIVAESAKQFALHRLVIGGFTVAGVLWLAGVAVHWLPATVLLFCCALIPAGVTNVIFAAIVQTYVPESLVGRVSSVMGSASVAAMPVGSLLGGIAGELWSASTVVAGGGVALFGMAVMWALHPRLRSLGTITSFDPEQYGLVESSSRT